jgi:hypothetical protein
MHRCGVLETIASTLTLADFMQNLLELNSKLLIDIIMDPLCLLLVELQ